MSSTWDKYELRISSVVDSIEAPSVLVNVLNDR